MGWKISQFHKEASSLESNSGQEVCSPAQQILEFSSFQNANSKPRTRSLLIRDQDDGASPLSFFVCGMTDWKTELVKQLLRTTFNSLILLNINPSTQHWSAYLLLPNLVSIYSHSQIVDNAVPSTALPLPTPQLICLCLPTNCNDFPKSPLHINLSKTPLTGT